MFIVAFKLPYASLHFSWFYGDIDHSKAENLLLRPENPNGAFLVRTSKKHENFLKLALKDTDTVRHYWIQQHEDSSYYIASWTKFCTIQELIDHHKESADGIVRQLSDPCVCIDQPCPVTASQSYKDEWETDRNALKFDKELGKDSFTEVWSGMWKNRTVAIKTLKPGTMEVTDFLAEAQIMKKLHHPNLLRLYAVCTLEEPMIVITELMNHGALSDYLQKGEGRNLKLRQLIDIAAQIAGGMAYLEEHSYIHRDLAARNILIHDRIICKVANFGSAGVIKEDIYNPHESGKFQIKWTAPEAVIYNNFSIKSDIWSFGVVIYELLTKGAMPYPGMNNHQVLEAVDQGYHMPPPDNCPDTLYNIMLSCWKREADKRPTFEHLKCQLKYYSVSAKLTPEDVYLAKYSYDARISEDLSFTKGEKLIIDSTKGDWWMGKSLTTGKEGYIPRNYLVPIANYELEE